MASQASRLSQPLPKGTWCSHMHVVEPDRFPLSAKAKYTPPAHTLADARSFFNGLGITNMVIVQPSIYGTDNACTLEALRGLGPQHGRAVVELDPQAISPDTLREWHALGVRGARVNLVSVGRDVTGADLQAELQRYADVVRPLGWVLQVFVPLELVAALEAVAETLDVKLCVDHFGFPTLPKPHDPSQAIDPYTLPGFASLVRLLRRGRTWVKISAPYRVSQDPRMRDLDALGRELVAQAPDQLVYASDWPHTRFEDIDPVPFIEMCYGWCGHDPALVDKLFRSNAERLWGDDVV